MHLAILMANTDESDFAHRHPKDGEKFSRLIQSVRPDWKLTVFSVKDGVFPEDIAVFDGFMISGSPASVHDDEAWVDRLLACIREIDRAKIPLFGACFGHQAIALALGGVVEENPNGWVFGVTSTDLLERAEWLTTLPATFTQYGAHHEIVTTPPKGARILASSQMCDISAYEIDGRIYTTQNHPEITPEFASALVEEYHDHLPEGVGDAAAASLGVSVDGAAYAETIALFFEGASRH